MLNHNKTANGGLVFSYSIFSYQKLLSFLFVCSLQTFPIFVRQSTVAIRKSPGIRMIHQDPVISALSDRDSILPHVITSIGSPMPIKLKVASEIIAVLTFMTTINMIDEKKFGTRCFHKTRKNPAPIHFAAMIYSFIMKKDSKESSVTVHEVNSNEFIGKTGGKP